MRDPARIAVDLLGGDDAPDVVVDGALLACDADPDLHLLLVGPPEAAGAILRALPAGARSRVSGHSAPRAADGAMPARAGGTVRAAVAAVHSGTADAVVSAGPSGATVTAAVLEFGRTSGVRHPALVATVPTAAGPVVLLDVGASPEVPATALGRYATLGVAYARAALGVAEPRVGLLSIGTETGSGDRLRREADTLLRAGAPAMDAGYVGLVEGHEVPLGGRANVVVTDGFTGNVLLKGLEGALALAGADLGADVPRGAALLGVPTNLVVCHGAATGRDIASGIAFAALLHRRGVTTRMSDLLDDQAEAGR